MYAQSECCKKPAQYKLEDAPAQALFAGWIVCLHCNKKYRPIHKGHSGGPTPDNCFVCREMLKHTHD
jgi:hypothetical protein